MYSRFSILQKLLIAFFIVVVGFAVFLFFTSSPTIKHYELVESADSVKNTTQNDQTILRKDIHYGYVNLDSIRTLTKLLPNFNNSKRISTNRIKDKATIDVKGFEYEFFGKDDGKQWRRAYKESLNSEGFNYDEGKGVLTMKYDKGCVLIPYQVLMQLTLAVNKNNSGKL